MSGKNAGKNRIDAALEIYLQPGASSDKIIGPHGDALKVAVSAPPEKGKANKALCRLLADELGVAKNCVNIVRGGASRRKQVSVAGVEPDKLQEILHSRRKG